MWEGIADLFGNLASTGGKIVVDAWVAMCMAVWNAGLWLTRTILGLGDWLLTPNLAPDGPSSLLSVYGVTLWLALGLALAKLPAATSSSAARPEPTQRPGISPFSE